MHALRNLKTAFQKAFRTLMPTCQQASRLQSDALDRPVGFLARLGLNVHLLLCRWCRRYGKQIRLLQRLVHEHPESLSEVRRTELSAQAKQRLKEALRRGPDA